MITVQPAIRAGISLGMIRHCGTFHGTIAPTTPTGDSVQVRLAEHTLATFHPREVAGGGQRQVDHRRGAAGLTQPAEAARGPHLVR